MAGVGPGYSYVADSARNPVVENGDWEKRTILGAVFVVDYKFDLL
jgi:hypothetical protein